jgi:hypothetical protein
MRVTGPDRYKLSFDSNGFAVSCSKGTTTFSGRATSKLPKLYIVAVEDRPIYVGVTKQSMRNRLRFGWKATGKGGYYGYSWRRKFSEASLDVWCHEDAPVEKPLLDIETVEAEVVFLIRCAGQWPPGQTEIHFHPSNQVHRDIAAVVVRTYGISNPTAKLDNDAIREER